MGNHRVVLTVKKVVALLDSMYNWQGLTPGQVAPRAFKINPKNLSGKRLYKLIGPHRLWVTNACPQLQGHASGHGKPNPNWVKENLALLAPFDLLLVCGGVAREAFLSKVYDYPNVFLMDHPAARRWTKESLEATRLSIARRLA